MRGSRYEDVHDASPTRHPGVARPIRRHSEPMIRLTTLGSAHLTADGWEITLAGRQPKRLALLAYLAVASPRGPHRRDTLVGLFWPELDQERARNALRQALHGVRRALGADAVDSLGMNALALRPDALTCDVWELEDAAARDDHEGVLALSQGELLAGLFVSDAPEFERWLDAERMRLRGLGVDAAWALAEQARTGSRPSDDVPRWVRRAVALSPCDEGAVRRGMRLLVDAGDRAGALAVFEQFAAALRGELEAEPSAETTALAHGLRATPAGVSPSPVIPARAGMPHSPVTPAKAGISPHSVSSPPSTEEPSEIPAFAGMTMTPPAPLGARWRARRTLLTTALALGALGLVGVARYGEPEPTVRDPRRVIVSDFVPESGPGDADALGRRAGRELRDALEGLGMVEVAAGSAPNVARAGTLVRGVVRRDADSVQYRAEVVDAARDVLLRAVESGWAPAASPDRALASLRDRVQAAVGTALYPGWSGAISRPASFAAYRLFVDGMERVRREEHDAAATALRRAYELDTGFTAAALLAAAAYLEVGRAASADSLARAIAARRSALAPVDAAILDWLMCSRRGDRLGALEAMRSVVALAPRAELARLGLAVDALAAARPEEALAALGTIDQDGDFARDRASFWATWAEALHAAGRHDRELATVRDGLARYPNLRVLREYELRALAALGRADEVLRHADALAAIPAGGGLDPAGALRRTASELHAHGDPTAARALLDRLLAWYAAHPPARADVSGRSAQARALYLAGDLAGARVAYDSLSAELPRCVDCAGALGVIAARAGDRAAAEREAARVAALSHPALLGRDSFWRARIAAALGEPGAAVALLTTAFARGHQLGALVHADRDLAAIHPAAVYRRYAGGEVRRSRPSVD